MYSDVLFFHKRKGNFKNLFSKGGGAGTYSDINNFHRGKGVDKRENNSEKDQLFSSRNFFEHLSCETLCWAQDSVIYSPFPWEIHI